ncbi:MAG: OmpA family protein [Nannocystaceae bacterium]
MRGDTRGGAGTIAGVLARSALALAFGLGAATSAAAAGSRPGVEPARVDPTTNARGPRGSALLLLGRRAPPPRPEVDSDGDQVPDGRDRCPYAPGLVDNAGCPEPDRDDDGFLDRDDRCPEEPGALPDGCPRRDRDGDGVLDRVDQCVEVPGEAPDGCPPPDRDEDGLLDRDDRCPEEAEDRNGFEDEDGCPDAIPEDLAAITGVVRGVHFEFDRDDLRRRSLPPLNRVVAVLRRYPAVRIEISGHVDATSSPILNRSDISGRRAGSVKRYFVDHGIDESRMETRGAGPDEPIDTNKTAAGRAKNRRIEIQLLLQ